MVHRQGADDHVERAVGEGQRGHVPDEKRGLAPVAIPQPVGVGAGAIDHSRVQIQTGHLQAVLASQPDRQVAWPAPDLEDPGAVGRARGDVGGDALDERAQQEPA